MRYCFAFAIALYSCLWCAHAVRAEEEDLFADYYKDTRKSADARVTNVYSAWGENMANLIKQNHRDGVVIDGKGEYADGKIHADGVGNVIVDKNANVGPVINKTEIKNSTVVIKRDHNRNNW